VFSNRSAEKAPGLARTHEAHQEPDGALRHPWEPDLPSAPLLPKGGEGAGHRGHDAGGLTLGLELALEGDRCTTKRWSRRNASSGGQRTSRVAEGVPSVLAALEVVVAVGAYWAIAIYFETTTHLCRNRRSLRSLVRGFTRTLKSLNQKF
jgi:hypothetical protein